MVYKIRTLMNEIIHEQEQKRRLELEALQAQINPHFLQYIELCRAWWA